MVWVAALRLGKRSTNWEKPALLWTFIASCPKHATTPCSHAWARPCSPLA